MIINTNAYYYTMLYYAIKIRDLLIKIPEELKRYLANSLRF